MSNAIIFILAKKDKVLLQRRDEFAKHYPKRWGLISGSIEPDESPEQALQREVKEELNYTVHDARFLGTEERNGRKYYFAAPYDGSELSLREGDGIVWWPFDEALALDMAPHHKAALERWLTDIRGL